jgi:hypothetical protein
MSNNISSTNNPKSLSLAVTSNKNQGSDVIAVISKKNLHNLNEVRPLRNFLSITKLNTLQPKMHVVSAGQHTSDEINQIIDITNKAFNEPRLNKQLINDKFTQGDKFFTLKENGKFISSLAAKPATNFILYSKPPKHLLTLDSTIYISLLASIKKGAGKMLLQQVAEHYKQQKIAKLILNVIGDEDCFRHKYYTTLGYQAIHANKDVIRENKKVMVTLYQQQLFP